MFPGCRLSSSSPLPGVGWRGKGIPDLLERGALLDRWPVRASPLLVGGCEGAAVAGLVVAKGAVGGMVVR